MARTADQIFNLLEPGTIVQHFKRTLPHIDKLFGLYRIIGIAKVEAERDKHVVVYRSLSNNQLWTRPVEDFISEVPETYKLNGDFGKYRFEIFKGSDEEIAEVTTLMSQNIPSMEYPLKKGDCNGTSEEKN